MDENLTARFTEMALVSGDGIFAEKVSQLAGQGLATTVYAHEAGLAKRLEIAATKVVTTAIHLTSAFEPLPNPRKAH